MGLIRGRDSASMVLLKLHPVPPAATPDSSLAGWIVLAVVLAFVVMGGLVLASRR